MKKLILSLIALLSGVNAALAVTVFPKPHLFTMPDGTQVTLVGHGDEYLHYTTTTDGYTILQSTDGYYHYAQKVDGKLIASDVIAHDLTFRSANEKAYINGIEKGIRPTPTAAPRKMRYLGEPGSAETTGPAPLLAKKEVMGQDKFRGLVILVNFNDCQFRYGDDRTREIFDSIMNVENYPGYYDEELGFQKYTGSVHDYFRDNSYGQFTPQFDVVGPVTIDKSKTYPEAMSNSYYLTKAVLNAVDPLVDFSDYDCDNDGFVDMFYVIYAGYASSYIGNDSKYLWPHASTLEYDRLTKDGKRMGRYACSAEIYGWENMGENPLDGIGIICHEFSHVLGFMDHYDTSEEGSNENPGTWDVMAAGNYNGTYSRTPVGYNAYEKITAGFLAPDILTTGNIGESLTLPALSSEAKAFKIATKQKKEHFLIENRQKEKWDSSLPGTGMLVWRVDSTNYWMWEANQVNATNHPYFKLIRANGWKGSDTAADAFPGTKKVTTLTNKTSPANLLSYAGYESDIVIKKITETEGMVSFSVESPTNALPEGYVFYESFDDCNGVGGNDGKFGSYTKGNTLNADNIGWTYKTGVGCNQCALFGSTNITRESAITPEFTIEEGKTYTLSFLAAPYGSNGTALQVSVNAGDGQLANDSIAQATPATSSVVTMKKNQWTQCSLTLTGSGTQKIKFYGNTSSAKMFYIDEVIVKEKEEEVIDPKDPADVNGDGVVNIADINAVITVICSGHNDNPNADDNLNADDNPDADDNPNADDNLNADVNGDGVVNIADVNAIISTICGE